VASLAQADGLAVVAEDLDGVAAGQLVEVFALADL
jgi:molybdopterin biosynthesis enzyme